MNQFAKENFADNTFISNLILRFKTQVISSLVFLVVSTLFGFVFSKKLIRLLEIKSPFLINFVQIYPEEVLFTSIIIAVLFGLYFFVPFVIYNFLAPSWRKLREVDKKLILQVGIGGFVLFTLGILFGYYVLIPFNMLLLLGFNAGVASVNLSISKYVSFCIQIMMFTAIAFEYPILILLLLKTNIIMSKELMFKWKKVLIGALITSFLLSSSDLFALIILTAIILFYYAITVYTAKRFRK